jgi:undecaprenyl-diphosphatase
VLSVKGIPLRPLEHFTRRSVIGIAIVIAAATGFGALLLLVRLGYPPLERFDRGAATALNHVVADNSGALKVMEAITRLGGNLVMWWLVTVTAAGMLIRRQVNLAAYLVVTGLGALALAPLIRVLVRVLRTVISAPALGNTFPSAQALNATVFCSALLLVFLPVLRGRLRGLMIGLVVAVIVAVGLTRVALGIHYLTDVIGGWLLGVAWVGMTAHAFRRWRLEAGQSLRPLSYGLEPGAAPLLAPTHVVAFRHPWRAAASLLVGWVLIVGAVSAVGALIITHAPAFDEAVPGWLASLRTPQLNTISYFWSQAGGTQWILAVSLVFGPLAMACVHRWRPAVFLAVTMFGEVGLFLSVTATVGRPRPLVTHLDGYLATSSFPSGHVAATVCLYGAIAVVVVPRVRRWWRWLALAVAVLMPALVAFSRMYRGEHHPLDVTGGIVMALLWLGVVTLVVQPNADLRDGGKHPGVLDDTTNTTDHPRSVRGRLRLETP